VASAAPRKRYATVQTTGAELGEAYLFVQVKDARWQLGGSKRHILVYPMVDSLYATADFTFTINQRAVTFHRVRAAGAITGWNWDFW